MQWDSRAETDERHYDIGADMEAGDRRCCFDRSKRSGGDPDETAVFVGSQELIPEGESGARLVLLREVETWWKLHC